MNKSFKQLLDESAAKIDQFWENSDVELSGCYLSKEIQF